MEFGLRVHFALWPLLPVAGLDHGAAIALVPEHMHALQEYLCGRGAHFACQPAFLSYFALPHVDPDQLAGHPSFAHLFADKCTTSQRDRLAIFLRSLPSTVNVPSLYHLHNLQQQHALVNVPPAAACMPVVHGEQILKSTKNLDSFLPDASPFTWQDGPETDDGSPAHHHKWHVANRQLQAANELLSAGPGGNIQDSPLRAASEGGCPQPAPGTDSASGCAAQLKGTEPGPAHQLGCEGHLSPEPCKSPDLEANECDLASGLDAGEQVAACWGMPMSTSNNVAAVTSARSQGLAASVARSLVQQALLPAIDWKKVKNVLPTADVTGAARLLQVSWPCFVQHGTSNIPS